MKYTAYALYFLFVAAGCRAASSPASVVRALDEAAREGDVARVMKLLGPRTRARLEADARRAAEQAGRRKIGAADLLAVGWTPPRFELDGAREVSRTADGAVVELEGRHGERERVTVVREGAEWKVELP